MKDKEMDAHNEGFEETMEEAKHNASKGKTKESKLYIEEDFNEAMKGIKDAVKETFDPKDHKFKFKPGRGKILIYAPPPPKEISGIELQDKTRAEIAADYKDSKTFIVYGIGDDENQYKIGDKIFLTSLDSWISINLENYVMKIVENYQILGKVL